MGVGKGNGRGGPCPEWLKPHRVKPGQVLNPAGRNGSSHAERLRQFIHQMLDKKCVITNEDGERETTIYLDALARMLCNEAMAGKNSAVRIKCLGLLFDRIDPVLMDRLGSAMVANTINITAPELEPDSVRDEFYSQLVELADGGPITSEVVMSQLEMNRARRNGNTRTVGNRPVGGSNGPDAEGPST